jgi:tetrachlorobenzoquinone reductase
MPAQGQIEDCRMPLTGDAAPTIPMRVTAIRYAAQDTNLYEFRRPDGAVLPPVQPGCHIDIHLPSGMLRQYSLVTADGDPAAYVIGVKRDRLSRGGSSFIHDRLRVGQIVEIGGPRNNFPLNEDAGHTVLIAGGIGITPIWCMAQRLAKLGRGFELHYACRERGEAAFIDELQRLAVATLHFDAENEGRFLDIAAIVAAAPLHAHHYCCGPLPMLAGFEAATKLLPPETVHAEYFAPKQEAATAGGYIVELRRSGRQFEIVAGKTILQVLRGAGIEAPYSCEEGICGACEVAVLSGTPDHRDNVLSESARQAGNAMMICCSGSKSAKLVLDL